MKLNMIWRDALGIRKNKSIWAALCTGRADGSSTQYPFRMKHGLMVMVSARESGVERKICALLKSNGWQEVAIQNLKLLDEPFESEDQTMLACYEGAVNKDGGIVVYSDPIEEA